MNENFNVKTNGLSVRLFHEESAPRRAGVLLLYNKGDMVSNSQKE